MKQKIQKIIEEGIGEDKDTSAGFGAESSDFGYNQALEDLRAKCPEIAEKIVEGVVRELDKMEFMGNIPSNMIRNIIINHLTK